MSSVKTYKNLDEDYIKQVDLTFVLIKILIK